MSIISQVAINLEISESEIEEWEKSTVTLPSGRVLDFIVYYFDGEECRVVAENDTILSIDEEGDDSYSDLPFEMFKFYAGEVVNPEDKEKWGDVVLVVFPKEEYAGIIGRDEVREYSVKDLTETINDLNFGIENLMEAVFTIENAKAADVENIQNCLIHNGMEFNAEIRNDFGFFA